MAIWDAKTGKKDMVHRCGMDCNCLRFSRDGKRLLLAHCGDFSSWIGRLEVLDAKTGACLLHVDLKGHGRKLLGGAFSHDGERLATVSEDRTVRVWDTNTGQVVLVLRGHESEVVSAAFSLDGSYLATSSRDGMVKLWDATPPLAPP